MKRRWARHCFFYDLRVVAASVLVVSLPSGSGAGNAN